MNAKLVLTALLSLAAGVGGTYATVHVTAICTAAPAVAPADDDMKAFMSQPAPPLTGYPRYK